MRSRKQWWVALATAALLGGSTLAGNTAQASPSAEVSTTVLEGSGSGRGGADAGQGESRSGRADLSCTWGATTFEAPVGWTTVDERGATRLSLPALTLPEEKVAADVRIDALDVTAVLDVDGRRVEFVGGRRHDEPVTLGDELALPTLSGDAVAGDHASLTTRLTTLAVRPGGTGGLEPILCSTGVLDEAARRAVPVAGERATDGLSVTAAAAATGATVSGRVTVPAGIDPEDVRVYAWYSVEETWEEDGEEYTETYWDWEERAWVSEDGTYVFDDLPVGEYVFEFRHEDAYGYHGGDSRDTATRVTVTGGTTLAGINGTMTRYGAVTGTVRGVDGEPLADGWVTAYRWWSDEGGGYWEYEDDVRVEDGLFRMTGLPTGTYVFGLDAGRFHTAAWFGGTSQEDATRVDVVFGVDAEGIDIVFEPAGSIEGWLDPSAEAHLVWLYRFENGHWVQHGRRSSDPWGDPADARYEFGALPAGSYRVGLARYDDIEDFWADADQATGGSPTTWFPSSTTLAGAQDVVVTLGRASKADFVQSPYGSVSGRITVPSGIDPADMLVDVYRVLGDDDYAWVGEVSVRPDGTYHFEDLLPGTYRVRVGHEDYIVDEVTYPDAADVAEGDDVTVTRGNETTGISMTVLSRGSISGTVSGVSGAAAAKYEVGLFGRASVGSTEFAELIGTSAVDVSGRFAFPDRRAYTYYLGVRDTSVPSAWSMLGGGSSPLDSTQVVLGKGQDLTGFVLVPETGVLKGRVTGPGGAPVVEADVHVDSVRPDGNGGSVGSVVTDENGNWTLHGVGPGTFRVIAYGPDDLVWNWFGDVRHFNYAPDVVLGKGQTRTGLDISLVRGGRLKGTVGAHDPDALVVVRYYRLEDGEWRLYMESGFWGDDGEFGEFETGLLHPGRYRVGVAAGWDQEPRTFVGGPTLAKATEFTVRSGETTAGVNAHLAVRATTPPSTQTPQPPKPVAKVLTLRKAPKVTGKAKVGKTLKASKGTWRSSDPKAKVTVKFQWQSQKGKKAVNVAKATKSKLKLTKKLKGKKVRVRVTVSAPGHASVVHVGKWSKKVA